MFEESLIASRVEHLSSAKRWTMAGSMALQGAAAALLITLPLMHPEHLTFHASTPLVFTPPPPRPPLPQTQVQSAESQGPSVTGPLTTAHPIAPIHPGLTTDEPPIVGPITSMGPTAGFLETMRDGVGSGRPGVAPAIPKPPERLKVSGGVAAGMLISPIRPIYPPIAKAAGISGTVVVEAVILKTGTIESLHVVSGPEMLRQAALDAIRVARYQPFRLNGEPTEVQTTITVNFRIGG